MAWTLGGQRIYVQEADEAMAQIAPRLQPLSGGSIVQSFGYDSTIRTISAIVVGDTIKNALKNFSKDGMTAHAFVSPEGSLGNWMVKGFKANRTTSTCQSIDQTQPEDAPVYECQIELWIED
jgi:hypothetical protein